MSDSPLAATAEADAIRPMRDAAHSRAAHLALDPTFRAWAAPDALGFGAESLEIVGLRLARSGDSQESRESCRAAFELIRAMLPAQQAPTPSLEELRLRTRGAAFGVLGDLRAQCRQVVSVPEDLNRYWPSQDWGVHVEAGVLSVWQLLMAKRTWDDLDRVHEIVSDLRNAQEEHEPGLLRRPETVDSDAWRLVALYHLLRAAEILAEYQELGSTSGHFDVVEQMQVHFDRASSAGEMVDGDLAFLSALLEVLAGRLVDSSIWTTARATGARVGSFITALASRERPNPILELLPPQRRALLDEGLLGSGRRSIVISLPTSAGKTLLAEFRLLQALDLYESEQGWVAYTAPTRALVNQITARLRRDLTPLGLRVERFSPALEVDSVEESILKSEDDPFRVVVTTPEKLDLLIRGGWTSELGRPLSLVIVDEAHNLANGARGLRLELLLATVNREEKDAAFLLMTPFVPNVDEVAKWLDPNSNQSIELGLEWLPNDRLVGLSRLERGGARGDSRLVAEPLAATPMSLFTPDEVELSHGRPLGLTWSALKSPTLLATATAMALEERGTTVTLVMRPDMSWSAAERLAADQDDAVSDPDLLAVQEVLQAEFGAQYPLANYLGKGVAVHHAGLSDDVRSMVEALAERGVLSHIVATTTLAQGINFPISNVVLGSFQYPYGVDMPPEDFWNIAGRAGRFDHGQPGIVLLAAHDQDRATKLRQYVMNTAEALASTLLDMVDEAIERTGGLDLSRLAWYGSWSSFVQFITHTYRIVGAEQFAAQVEQVLRGTLGFRELREQSPERANLLLDSVRIYATQLSGKAISLVDSTGFSWESVSATLGRLDGLGVGDALLQGDVFGRADSTLSDAIGLLLQVPELREQLVDRLDPAESQGDFLSRVVRDWVQGESLSSLATSYFATGSAQGDATKALTKCCQKLFGSILPTVSWGMSALQALSMARTGGEVSDSARDTASYIYYGVDSRDAVALRLFGVPRGAAKGLTAVFGSAAAPVELRERLLASTSHEWRQALGPHGDAYFQAWRLVEAAV